MLKCLTFQLLPQGFTYKPPINIRLLDQRANGFTPLVGKYVLKSFSQYDPEYLKKKLAAAEAEGSSTTEESEGNQKTRDTDELENLNRASSGEY